MAQPYISQIGMFGGNFAPVGYAYCNGTLIAINQNTALFSLIGTTYGGDGRTTFALPELRGRVPLHRGQGPGTSFRQQGAMFGVDSVALSQVQMPVHNHELQASATQADSPEPSGNVVAPGMAGSTDVFQFTATAPNAAMNAQVLADSGAHEPHTNMMPVIAINFIIALQGVFPSRN